MSVFPGRTSAPRMNEIPVVHICLVMQPEEGCDFCNEQYLQTCESFDISDGAWMDKDKWLCTACSKYGLTHIAFFCNII